MHNLVPQIVRSKKDLIGCIVVSELPIKFCKKECNCWMNSAKSMTFSKVKICMCVFTETLKSTWSTSWTRITFENARIVFLHTNNCHDPQHLLATYDAIFVKNILCIDGIVETHSSVPHHHGHNAVAWHLVFVKRPLNSCYQFCLQDLLVSMMAARNKKSKASNNTH